MSLGKASIQNTPVAHVSCIPQVCYQEVRNKNTSNLPNKLTNDKLIFLEHFSKQIDQPLVPGQFNNEKHYLETLKLVLESTHETRARINFYLNEILPMSPSKKAFLDVGPGDGSVAQMISPYFQHLTAIDSNAQILDELELKLENTIKTSTIKQNILYATLPQNHFDLALLSHVLYYIPAQDWLKVVNSTFESLTEHGVLVITLGGDELGKAELIHHFGGSTLEIDALAKACIEMFSGHRVTLYASQESFVTSNAETMFHIAAFMLADGPVTASKNELMDYIEHHFKRSNNLFEMTTKQKFIVIQKQSNLNKDTLFQTENFYNINVSEN